MTLAGQFLALQLAIIAVVLVAVAAVSLAQSARTFERVEGRRVLSVAETVAVNPLVRGGVPERATTALRTVAESARTTSGVSSVELADADGVIVTSPTPARAGKHLPLQQSTVLQGRAWTGTTVVDGHRFLTAHVPVLSAEPDRLGELVGIVSAAREYPSTWERLRTAVPNLLTYLGIASVVGIGGSWLLARRIKRQTHGLEPREIAGLVEHREAMLHGIKEGVIALDMSDQVTLVNDVAVELLSLPDDAVGRSLIELGVSARLNDVLTGRTAGEDEVVVGENSVLILNRMPVRSRGRLLGSVTTLRDRTELAALQRELGTTQTASETLRAQTHEFANQLHIIAGLIQLEQYDDVVRYVDSLSRHRDDRDHDFMARLDDPALSALLIAKTSLASERGANLSVTPASRLPRFDADLSADLATVVGNLVDNALDAMGTHGGLVEVDLRLDDDVVQVTVRDSGPGIPPQHLESLFQQGFTTKKETAEGQRGFGLALVRVVVGRRGGDVRAHNADGAVFVARLPVTRSPSAPVGAAARQESAR